MQNTCLNIVYLYQILPKSLTKKLFVLKYSVINMWMVDQSLNVCALNKFSICATSKILNDTIKEGLWCLIKSIKLHDLLYDVFHIGVVVILEYLWKVNQYCRTLNRMVKHLLMKCKANYHNILLWYIKQPYSIKYLFITNYRAAIK